MTSTPNQLSRVHQLLFVLVIALWASAAVLGNYQIAHAEPSTIRVWRTELQRVDVVDFQAYLRVVLPEEWIADWQDQDGTPESLRAGAVAVRTFGWYYVLHPQCPSVNPPNCPAVYDLTDTSQTYDPLDPGANHPNTNQAIADTAGQYLTYSGAMLWARYGQHNGDPTVAYAGYDPPLSSVSEPIDVDETRTGHGNGVCQYGSRHWARGRSANGIDFPQWGYQRILVHYYTGVHIRDANGTQLTSDYRWNALQINNAPTQVPPGHTSYVSVWVQNTGTASWFGSGGGGPIAPTHALSYRIYDMVGVCAANCDGTNRTPLDSRDEKDPGDDLWRTVPVYFPSNLMGPVVIRFDMVQLDALAQNRASRQGDKSTHMQPSATTAAVDFWFADYGQGWYTQDNHVCVGGCAFLPFVGRQF